MARLVWAATVCTFRLVCALIPEWSLIVSVPPLSTVSISCRSHASSWVAVALASVFVTQDCGVLVYLFRVFTDTKEAEGSHWLSIGDNPSDLSLSIGAMS